MKWHEHTSETMKARRALTNAESHVGLNTGNTISENHITHSLTLI